MSCFGNLFGRSTLVNQHRYRVIRRIGEGGFSFVDLVTRQDEDFALKSILIQVPEQRAAVENEIRVHRSIQHPYVMQLVDAELKRRDDEEALALLVFPYYQNGSLQDLIEHAQRKKTPLDEEKILRLFHTVCQGLNAMHNHPTSPVVHRDIKPANLLLNDTQDGLIITDLGSTSSAKCTITNRQEALALQEHCAQTCTAHYRAPELFEVPSECVITEKTDVWSLGCSLYAAAFGQSPCDGSALAAMSGRIMFPRQHTYSKEFCDLVKAILQVDPAQRPSVSDVDRLIGAILSQRETTTNTVPAAANRETATTGSQ